MSYLSVPSAAQSISSLVGYYIASIMSYSCVPSAEQSISSLVSYYILLYSQYDVPFMCT